MFISLCTFAVGSVGFVFFIKFPLHLCSFPLKLRLQSLTPLPTESLRFLPQSRKIVASSLTYDLILTSDCARLPCIIPSLHHPLSLSLSLSLPLHSSIIKETTEYLPFSEALWSLLYQNSSQFSLLHPFMWSSIESFTHFSFSINAFRCEVSSNN